MAGQSVSSARAALERAQGQGHLRLGAQGGMAGHEDQAQQLFANLDGVACGVQLVHEVGHQVGLGSGIIGRQRTVLACQHGAAAQAVQGAVACGGHEPGGQVGWGHARTKGGRAKLIPC